MVINKIRQIPADLRRRHRAIAMSEVQANPGIGRAEIARRLGLSDMAATRIVRELLDAKIVNEHLSSKKKNPNGRSVGRPKIGLNIREGSVFGAGMTFSAYYSEVSISNGNGEIIERRQVKNAPFSDPLECARLFSKELAQLILETGIPRERICGVGIVLSAKVIPETGAILHSYYFGWGEDNGAFCNLVTDLLNMPVTIRNIADAIAIAEIQYGIAQNVNNLTLIHTASLMGASIVANGKVLLGNDGFAGRIGHIKHETKEYSCVCGRNDCLDLSASGFAILKSLGLHDDPCFQAQHIAQYADLLQDVVNDNPHDALKQAGESIVPFLDMVSSTLNPELIILTGFVGGQKEYVEGAIASFNTYRPKDFSMSPQIMAGSITGVEAAPMLALSDLCFSELFDFEGFLESSHLVKEE